MLTQVSRGGVQYVYYYITYFMTTKDELQKQLQEVEAQIKSFQQQFKDIKKRVKDSVSSSKKRADNNKLLKLRKQLGLDS